MKYNYVQVLIIIGIADITYSRNNMNHNESSWKSVGKKFGTIGRNKSSAINCFMQLVPSLIFLYARIRLWGVCHSKIVQTSFLNTTFLNHLMCKNQSENLTCLVSNLERTLKSTQFAIRAIDIEGAFNNTSLESMWLYTCTRVYQAL